MSNLHQSIDGADGVITFWSLAGHSRRDEMVAALTTVSAEYGKMVPPPRTLLTGLVTDALKDLFPGRDGYFVRFMKKRKKWIVKQEVVEDDDVVLKAVCQVTIEQHDPNDATTEYVDVKTGYTSERYGDLLAAIEKQKGLAPAAQVSEMLTAILKSFPGVVSLRPTGGIYVLTDRPSQEKWELVASQLLRCAAGSGSNKVYRVDYKINEHSIEAIRDALLQEVAQFSENLEKEINETDPDKQLGARALKGRQKAAEAMLSRVSFLEGALSCRLQDARDMVERVRVAAGQTALLSTVTAVA